MGSGLVGCRIGRAAIYFNQDEKAGIILTLDQIEPGDARFLQTGPGVGHGGFDEGRHAFREYGDINMYDKHADIIMPPGPTSLPKIYRGVLMTEQETRDFFEHLPLDDRLRLVRDILGDIEGRISRARAELNGESLQLILPSLEGVAEDEIVPPIPEIVPNNSLAPAARQLAAAEPADENPLAHWDDLQLADVTGGQSHTIHRLRLMDAAAQYEKLLKKYGYVKGVPDPQLILKQEFEAAQAGRKQHKKPETAWAEWVGKDSETLDRPIPHDWGDWVALGDDDPEA